MPTDNTASMPSKAHASCKFPCTQPTSPRPTPAPQVSFHYGLPQDGPNLLIDMIKFMASIIFRLEHPKTMLDACQQCHWGAHASTILGMHITWTLWKHVLVPMWIIDYDQCKYNTHWDSEEWLRSQESPVLSSPTHPWSLPWSQRQGKIYMVYQATLHKMCSATKRTTSIMLVCN